jgi:hypothetical protein
MSPDRASPAQAAGPGEADKARKRTRIGRAVSSLDPK